MARAAASTILILAACSVGWAQAAEGDAEAAPLLAPEPAALGAALLAADAAAATGTPDLCEGFIDPYNPIGQRQRFFQAAGTDNELDEGEFAASQALAPAGDGEPTPFCQKFDRWALMLAFDRNANRKIDWFEADAYRKALRLRVLAAFDTDEDGQLTGAEREAANRALAAGKTTPLPAATSSHPTSSPSRPQPDLRDLVARYDADHDGKLGGEERHAVRQAVRERTAAQRRKYELWRYDADGDGRLSQREQSALEAEKAKRRETIAKRHKEWMEKYDADGDGRLSAAERRAADRAVADEYHKNVLQEYDANHDGKLDEQERARMQEGWQKRAEERRKSYELERFDKNGNGRIDESERAVLEELREEQERTRWEWTASLDADGDGKVSAEEREAARRDGSPPPGRKDAKPQEAADARAGDQTPEPFEDGEMNFGDDDPNATYRQRLLKKYDADGDGYLNTEERARMWRDLYSKGLGSGDEKPRERE